MRIALYSPTYPGISGEGGIGTYTRHLAHGLCAMGHAVHVLTPNCPMSVVRDGDVSVHSCSADRIRVVDRAIPGLGSCWRVSEAMRKLVSQEKIEVVEFPNWEGTGLLYAMRRSRPLVVRLHTSSLEAARIDGETGNRFVQWDVRRERWLAGHADVLVTHSAAHRLAMAQELGLPQERIAVVPHGVPVFPAFRRGPRNSSDFRVVYLGRLEKRKGTLDLLAAIPLVLGTCPNVRFIFIGRDRPHCPGGRTHVRYVEEEFPPEIKSRVEILGRLSDEEVDRHLQTADVFVAPSLYESFGLIFLEAMRWGTPVVGTYAGGIPEIIEDGRTGLLAPPQAPKALANAISSLLRNEELRLRLGWAGRKRVEEVFSIQCMAREVEALYTDAARTAGRTKVQHASAP